MFIASLPVALLAVLQIVHGIAMSRQQLKTSDSEDQLLDIVISDICAPLFDSEKRIQFLERYTQNFSYYLCILKSDLSAIALVT
jgi:hypothetical protein